MIIKRKKAFTASSWALETWAGSTSLPRRQDRLLWSQSLSASKASGGEIGGAGESPHYREASSTPKSLVTHEFLLTYLTHCHLTQEMGFLSDSSGQNQVDEVTRRRNQINKKKDPWGIRSIQTWCEGPNWAATFKQGWRATSGTLYMCVFS